jgi:hypothetical protein
MADTPRKFVIAKALTCDAFHGLTIAFPTVK